MNPKLQAHGVHVLKFGRMVPNFGRIGELTNAILEMLRSQDWRDYVDATGEYHFRSGEFDYFLAEHAVAASDLPRLYLKPADKLELQAAMDDRNKDDRYRRTPDAAMRAHPGGSLGGNWTRYGWDKAKHPLGLRAVVRARTGVTWEKHAQEQRQHQVKDRRMHLNDLIAVVMKRTHDDTERRYIIDELRKRVGKRGRPSLDHQQWARDAKRLKGDAKALIKHWGITEAAAYRRLTILKSRFKYSRKAS